MGQIQVNGNDAVVNKIIQNTENNNEIIEAPFGVDDKNVQMYYESTNGIPNKAGNLHDFFARFISLCQQWKSFKENGWFVYYGKQSPVPNSRILIWYDTTGSNWSA